MTIRLEFGRIPPGVEIGPHAHAIDTIVYLAGGELVFEHGPDMGRRTIVRSGDALYEAAAETHRVRNEGPTDALTLMAVADPDPRLPGSLFGRGEVASDRGAAGGTLEVAAEEDPVGRHDAARVSTRDGIRKTHLVEPGAFGSMAFTVTVVILEPGAADTWHRHPGTEHALVVLDGRGTITVGDVVETLEPLKGIRILPDRPHRVINEGRHRLRYVVCASPGLDPTVDRREAHAPRRSRDA